MSLLNPKQGAFSRALDAGNKKLLFANIALLIAVIAIAIAGATSFFELVRGPTKIDASGFTSFNVSAESFNKKYVTLSGTRIIDTGASEITVRKKRGIERGRSESAHYYALDLGDGKFLMIRGNTGAHNDAVVTGWLKEPAGSVDRSTLSEINAGPAQGRMYTNVIVDETETGDFQYVVAVLLCLGVLLSLWNIFKALGRNKDLSKLPAIKTQGAEALNAPEAFIKTVDADLPTMDKGNVVIGQSFAMRSKNTQTELVNFAGLLWCYLEITRKKIYYVIPAGSTYAIALGTQEGKLYKWGMKNEQHARTALDSVHEAAPWALYGHSDDLEAAWNKQRPALIKAVAERKEELANPTAPAAAQNDQVEQAVQPAR